MNRKVSIILVDDHPVVREGIRSYISRSAHLDVVGEAANGTEAIQLAKRLKPQIILMDINMPGMNGLDATALLRDQVPASKILILTVHDSREYVQEIARAGAHGYVLKDAPPGQLLEAIERLANGRKFFSPGIAEHLLDAKEKPKETELSPRERQVLIWITQGFSTKEIAQKMNLSVNSARTYRKRLTRKLNLQGTTELTRYAVERKMIPPLGLSN